jgi:hypothetical protein
MFRHVPDRQSVVNIQKAYLVPRSERTAKLPKYNDVRWKHSKSLRVAYLTAWARSLPKHTEYSAEINRCIKLDNKYKYNNK